MKVTYRACTKSQGGAEHIVAWLKWCDLDGVLGQLQCSEDVDRCLASLDLGPVDNPFVSWSLTSRFLRSELDRLPLRIFGKSGLEYTPRCLSAHLHVDRITVFTMRQGEKKAQTSPGLETPAKAVPSAMHGLRKLRRSCADYLAPRR